MTKSVDVTQFWYDGNLAHSCWYNRTISGLPFLFWNSTTDGSFLSVTSSDPGWKCKSLMVPLMTPSFPMNDASSGRFRYRFTALPRSPGPLKSRMLDGRLRFCTFSTIIRMHVHMTGCFGMHPMNPLARLCFPSDGVRLRSTTVMSSTPGSKKSSIEFMHSVSISA